MTGLILRSCARPGCQAAVKKATNKYCSRECCSRDPERIERLRESSLQRLVPLVRQLGLSYSGGEESGLALVCSGVEEAPSGLSRLAV